METKCYDITQKLYQNMPFIYILIQTDFHVVSGQIWDGMKPFKSYKDESYIRQK